MTARVGTWMLLGTFAAVLPVGAQTGPVGGRFPDPPAAKGPAKPAPRLPDGHPDLGNGKGRMESAHH